MKTSEKIMLILVSVLIVSQVIEISCIKVQTITHILPFSTELFQDTHEQPSSRLVYGVCDNNETSYDCSCTLIVETNEPPDSYDHLRFCDITIRSSSMPVNRVKNIYALDENTVILQFLSRYNRFAIVNFSDCRVVYPKIHDDWKVSLNKISAPFNGTFDVIVQDNRKESPCLRAKWCRMIVDVNGNVIQNPTNWVDEYNDIIDIVHIASGKRLVVDTNSVINKTFVRVYKVDSNGLVKILKEYPAGNLHPQSNKITVSSTHKLLTVCALNYSNLTCGQFDHHGALKIETNFKPIDFTYLHSAKVFNLPDGGFLLLTINCSKIDFVEECLTGDEKYFSLRIFDPVTQILKSLEIAQLKCGDRFNLDAIHFVRNENKNICLSYVCDYRGTDGRVSVEVNCFTKKDLSGDTIRRGIYRRFWLA
ncbi:uncharacterized protein LOC131673801 [Phymastichus coffea]|uniref:uncharacterized protein LOC131667830 n=1 Tax=Phymastichus coffea TaxID=108790 RepID=UPI00273C1C82|nr:uncharacterized protein LOC131667830 [Phymastichus coffea]XP_058797524.1 uncharacterized protein LOC131667830 [Phymastichus coffea]XP_058808077.1 uncharacterized protein LOC131673801 [Phymastichus coffea]XP_058808078.1 uncharacterized protein LOC131673801 [Phymastichus coffea]